MSDDLLAQALDGDITLVHERFVVAMANRLPSMAHDSKERYFVVLSALVNKLELGEKDLREILQEMMSEMMPLILQELNAPR